MDDAEFQEYKESGEKLLGNELEIDDPEYVAEIYQVILMVVEAKLNSFPTTLKQDIALSKNKEMSINTKASLQIRMSEKALLHDLRKQLIEEITEIEPESAEDLVQSKNKKNKNKNKSKQLKKKQKNK